MAYGMAWWAQLGIGYGLARHSMVYGMAWLGNAWNGIWYDLARHSMVYGMEMWALHGMWTYCFFNSQQRTL